MLNLEKQEEMIEITLTWIDPETGKEGEGTTEVESFVFDYLESLHEQLEAERRAMPKVSLN